MFVEDGTSEKSQITDSSPQAHGAYQQTVSSCHN